MILKKNRQVAVLLLCAVIAVSSCEPAAAATKAQLQQEKNNAQNKLNSANANVNELQSELAEAEEEVEQVDQELVELLAVMDILEDELEAKKQDVAESEEAYEEAKAIEEKQYEAMKARIRFMYEQGDSMYAEIIMQSGSFADVINKAGYVEKVYDYDREMLEGYQESKREAQQLHDQYVEEEAELEGLQLEYKEQQSELEKVLSEKKAVVENFDEKLQKAKNEAKRYEAQVKSVNTEIAKIAAAEKAAREKAEAEAKKRAAQEAARRAEAEKAARKKAEEEGKEYTEDSQEGEYKDEPAKQEYSEDSQEGEYKSEPEIAAPKPSATGSGTGQELANYACQFIGNPYVAGGSSLTNGTDCSGFTMSVYSHFGYSIPRTSSSQMSYGTGVSYSEAKAGDIVCYAGHVGIYLGNGTIVHASTPATGIKVTPINYRPVLSIRRIIK